MTEERFITVAEAQALLDRSNHYQRRIKKGTVAQYRGDMEAEAWVSAVCPPILLSEDGQIIDGQHRLTAQVAANKDMLWDVKVVDPSSIVVVDTGNPRSLADTLDVIGFGGGGADNKRWGRLWSGMLHTAVYWQTGSWGNSSPLRSRQQQVQWIQDNPHSIGAAETISEFERKRGGIFTPPVGTMMSLWDIAEYGEGGETAIEFFTLLKYNQFGDSAITTRFYRIVAESRNPRVKTSVPARDMGLMIVRLYLAWLNEENVSNLHARRSSVISLPGYFDWVATNWSKAETRRLGGRDYELFK